MRLRLEALMRAARGDAFPALRGFGDPDPYGPMNDDDIERIARLLRDDPPRPGTGLQELLGLRAWWLPWLPGHPAMIRELPGRVRNVFRGAGLLTDSGRLAKLTGQRFLATQNLGWRSLVGLVALQERVLAQGLPGGRGGGRGRSESGARKGIAPKAVVSQTLFPPKADSLEEELEMVVRRWTRGERNADVVKRRLGLVDGGTETPQAVADEYAITRERVRQIVRGFERRARRGRGWLKPVHLRRAVAYLRKHSPLLPEEARAGLVRAGIARGSLDPKGLLRVASLLGVDTRGVDIVASPKRLARSLAPFIRQSLRVTGVGHVDEVLHAARSLGSGAQAAQVRAVIGADSDLEWLDDDREWFWRPRRARQPIARRMVKMLYVGGTLTGTQLAAGLARDRSMRGRVPPVHAIASLAARTAGVEPVAGLGDAAFRLGAGASPPGMAPMPSPAPLSASERTLLEVLRREGGVASSRLLFRLCVDGEGMAGATFNRCLSGPLLQPVGPGMYAPIGFRPAAAEVAAALARVGPPARTRTEFRREDADLFTLTIVAGDAFVLRGMLSIPASMAKLFQAEFTLRDGDDARPLRTRGGRQWGYGFLVRRHGVRPGDRLVLLGSLRERSLVLTGLERAGIRARP